MTPPARLSTRRYLDLLHEEGERLLLAAEGALELPVPTCPGWTVDDVVYHVGSVYAHKVAVLRLGRRPGEGEWELPDDDADTVAWCHARLHEVAAELARRDPAEPAWSWWEPEQTVGFWLRRMAHETAVHRADVEGAAGAVTPVVADLALDGIDELLVVHLADAQFDGTASMRADGAVVTVRIDGVRIRGSASAMLLWLWGRATDEAVSIEGEPVDVAAVRQVLREAAA